ncbi:MAG: hypothetical protein PQJ59_16335 [Spirochaetales bacterium]|nr:hypothetical protein [Spirochaetales bacterium]
MDSLYQIYGISFKTSYPFSYNLLPSDQPPQLQFTGGGYCKNYLLQGKVLRQGGHNEGDISLYRSQTHDTIIFENIAAFECGDDWIKGYMLMNQDQFLLEICFIGHVLAYWLERRGTLMLHASSLKVREGAVAFMAESTGGKTTTAAALLAAGYSLITDDILPVNIRHKDVFASPGFPQMKLLPDQLELFNQRAQDYDKIHPLFEKRRIPIGESMGSFYNGELPLKTLYLLDKSETGEPYSSPVKSTEALFALIRHSFAAELLDSGDRSRERLNRLGEIVKGIEIKRLHIPRGYDKLPALVDFIIQDA